MARRETKRIQLTERRIQAFEVPKKRTTVYDEEVRELGLRLERSGRRSFFWFRSVANKLVFKTIGEHPAMSLAEARAKAQELNHQRAEWKASDQTQANPFISEAKKGPVTFAQLVEQYKCIQLAKPHHPKETAEQFTWIYEAYLREFDERPVASIRSKEVREFHRRMYEKGKVNRKHIPGDWKEQECSLYFPAQVTLRVSWVFSLCRFILLRDGALGV